jgi:hypothetical protein
MAGWERRIYKLEANHKWTAKPGCQIFVADWGAVRFDIPQGWVPVPSELSVKVCDREPPHDDCALEFSVTHLAPIDWSGLSLAYLLKASASDEQRGTITWRGEVVEEQRGDLEIAWKALRWLDVTAGREACSFTALARRNHTQALVTLDYWRDDEGRFGNVWRDVLDTLAVGEQPPGLGRPAFD